MRYAVARYQSHQRDLAYRFYISEALRIISENTARFGGGSYMTSKFSDIVTPKNRDKRTGEEIVADIVNRAGLKVIK